MAKPLLIATVILVLVFVVSAEKKKISYKKLFNRRDPFPEPDINSPIPANVSLLTVTQRVDNFDPTNLDTWQQRYYMNNEFYRPGSPMFIFLSGEWEITPVPLSNSLMHNISRQVNASMFYLEHRYYGESRPTPNTTIENLQFLSPEQALADIAHFIDFIRSSVPGAANSDIILVGGQYSASLAVWFHQRYPHMALGVWASGAPLPSIVDFEEYKVAIGAAYRNIGGNNCYDAIESGFAAMQVLANAGDFDELERAFRLCNDLGPEDLPFFFTIIAEVYGIFPSTASEASIRGVCAIIQSGDNEIDNIAAIVNLIIGGDDCLTIDYDYIIEADRETSWDADSVIAGLRQWSYTLCSQIGWFHSSTSTNQPFGQTFPIEFYHESCRLVFGDSFTPERLQRNSDRFNTMYGGLEPEVTNTIFVYGELDPWNVIGRTTDLHDDATAIIISGGTQANDLGPLDLRDSPALSAAKRQITEIITRWVS